MKKLFILAGVLMLAAVWPQQGFTQQILQDFKKPLPKIELLPQEEWEKQSTLYEEVPFGDESLSYSIRLPEGWKKVTDGGMSTYQISNKVFGEIARYYGPARLTAERSSLAIQLLELEYQQTAEQWFLQYLLARGYNVQGLDSFGEDKVEALYVLIKNRVSYIVRASMQISGKRAVLTEYFMPIEFWDEEKAIQAQIIGSFSFKKSDKEIVEEMRKYLFLDVAEMSYPTSWELRAKPLRSIDYMEAQLLNISDQVAENKKLALNGKIEIKLSSVFAAESLESELELVKDKILEDGLKLGEVIEEPDYYVFSDQFTFANVKVYEATDVDNENVKYEIWLSMMSAGDYYYFTTLLTPSRDTDYYNWVRNSQTFRLINEQFAPMDESLVER